jgi:hypothetical protein
MENLSKKEISIIKKLNTPQKVQNFLDSLSFNFEGEGDTYMSPRKMLEAGKMHCFEGAIFACLCLKHHQIENYLVDLKVKDLKKDSDHTLCVFKIGKYWGAISKTNHAVLRWRDPIYRNIRELAISYFHEYFLDSGEKDLQSYSKPFDIWKKFGTKWVTSAENLNEIAEALDGSPHLNFVPKKNAKFIRKAGPIEIKGAAVTEWSKKQKVVK